MNLVECKNCKALNYQTSHECHKCNVELYEQITTTYFTTNTGKSNYYGEVAFYNQRKQRSDNKMSKKELVLGFPEFKVDEYFLLYDKTIVKITAWCEECEPREIYFAYRFWDRLKFKRKSAWVRETDIVGYGKTLKGAKRVRKLLEKEKPYVFRKKSKVKEGENDESI